MEDLFACLVSLHRAFGTIVALSHLADHVTIFGGREERKGQKWVGLTAAGSCISGRLQDGLVLTGLKWHQLGWLMSAPCGLPSSNRLVRACSCGPRPQENESGQGPLRSKLRTIWTSLPLRFIGQRKS